MNTEVSITAVLVHAIHTGDLNENLDRLEKVVDSDTYELIQAIKTLLPNRWQLNVQPDLAIALDIKLDAYLHDEAILNELIHAINTRRKRLKLNTTQKININAGGSDWAYGVLSRNSPEIMEECGATNIYLYSEPDRVSSIYFELGDPELIHMKVSLQPIYDEWWCT